MRVPDGESGVVGDRAKIGDVVVEPFQLQQGDPNVPRATRRLRVGRGLNRLAVRKRVADARVARDPLGQFHTGGRQPVFEQLLRPLMREVQARFHVDDRLAHHAEPEMPGLDHAGVYRSDRDFVHALAADRLERKRASIVGERAGRGFPFAQRMVVVGPERVPYERPGIRVTDEPKAEQILDLAFEARRRIVRSRERRQCGRLLVHLSRREDEPPLSRVRKEVVHEERREPGAPIVGRHKHQMRAEPAVHQFGECRHGWCPNGAMHFMSPTDTWTGDEQIALRDRAKERVERGELSRCATAS